MRKYEKVKVTRGDKHPYLGMIVNFQQPGVVVIGNPGFMIDLMKEYGEAKISKTPADESNCYYSLIVYYLCVMFLLVISNRI